MFVAGRKKATISVALLRSVGEALGRLKTTTKFSPGSESSVSLMWCMRFAFQCRATKITSINTSE
jgi:hypothetical protein